MELTQEAATTRRLFERIPDSQLDFQPHGTSMTLGQLCMHIALVPAAISGMAKSDSFDIASANFTPPHPASKDEVLSTHDAGIAAASDYFGTLTPETLGASWELKRNGESVFAMPRAFMLRSLLMNHWIHHRGQLSVYLRILEVPMPSVYGPSKDENPFG